MFGLGQCWFGSLVARPAPCGGKLYTAKDHRQFRRRNTQVGSVAVREGERAAFQPAQIKCKAVALPRKDLQAVPATIAEDEQITAKRVAAQMRRYDGCEPVNALASVLRLETNPNPSGQSER